MPRDPDRGPAALAPAACISATVAVVLLAVAGRYGYHRDELYFLAAGRHLAWGYPDQPPLVPLLARALSSLVPGSVAALRVPSALAAGTGVLMAALSARELGSGRAGQTLAAAAMGTGAVLFGMGHLLSTATFDFLAWSVILWLVARLLRTDDRRLWLPIGAVAAVGVLDSDLVAFLMAAVVVGILIAGPRDVLKTRWLWIGGSVALIAWSPYLAWQAGHGWPQLAVSRSIAAGSSGTSQPRALLLPEQLVLLSPYLAPVWLIGLARLLRGTALRWCRAIGVAYLVLAVTFVASGGKGYYLAGMFPVLLGAGAQPTVEWLTSRARRVALGLAVAMSAATAVVSTLPVVPVGALHDTPIVSVNYDTGETVGWPAFVREIAVAYRRAPSAAILTSNDGEAGAVDRFGPALGLPRSFSVHMGYWYWGPPPDSTRSALAIGFTPRRVAGLCDAPMLVARLDNRQRVDDDEQGAPVWVCRHLRAPWSQLWPRLKSIS